MKQKQKQKQNQKKKEEEEEESCGEEGRDSESSGGRGLIALVHLREATSTAIAPSKLGCAWGP